MIRASIIGASGYTGLELIRLLLEHPAAELVEVCSRSHAGKALDEVFPSFTGMSTLNFNATQSEACDVIFLAAPNGIAMGKVESLLAQGKKVIDLSADFRLQDASVWEAYYGMVHQCPDILKKAVYGLPELHRDKIAKANLIANPGCYPTSVLLGFYPLAKAAGLTSKMLIADCKSGVSGAGRKADIALAFSEIDGSFRAYNASKHRHSPEIQEQIDSICPQVELTFTPHLVPMTRGIFSTLYFSTASSEADVQALFEKYYANETFIQVLPSGSHPETRHVRGTNYCHIAIHKPAGTEIGKVLVVIDNLIKGASGQAVQNMNLMFGLAEETGLKAVAVLP